MGTMAYGHLYPLMLYYGRVTLLERCILQPNSKTEAVTLMTPEKVADRPSLHFHHPALDSFECTADLSDSRVGASAQPSWITGWKHTSRRTSRDLLWHLNLPR
jgi:hypothetical protein